MVLLQDLNKMLYNSTFYSYPVSPYNSVNIIQVHDIKLINYSRKQLSLSLLYKNLNNTCQHKHRFPLIDSYMYIQMVCRSIVI